MKHNYIWKGITQEPNSYRVTEQSSVVCGLAQLLSASCLCSSGCGFKQRTCHFSSIVDIFYTNLDEFHVCWCWIIFSAFGNEYVNTRDRYFPKHIWTTNVSPFAVSSITFTQIKYPVIMTMFGLIDDECIHHKDILT